MSPRKPRSHQLEDESRDRLRELFHAHNWITEDIDKDYGEDFLVRIVELGVVTELSFYVQVKSTESGKVGRSERATSVTVRMDVDHLNHWFAYSEAVVLAIYDATKRVVHWEIVQDVYDPNSVAPNAKTTTIRVPLGNVLDRSNLAHLRDRVRARHSRLKYETEAADALIAALRDQYNIAIRYAPQLLRAGLDEAGSAGFGHGN